MSDCLTFPFGNSPLPSLSSRKRLFTIIPASLEQVHDHRISDLHWHDYLQIWYTVSGTYKQIVNGVSYDQYPGSVMLILPYTIHRIDTSCSNLSDTVVFNLSLKRGAFEERCVPFLSHSYTDASLDRFYLSPSLNLTGNNRRSANNIFTDIRDEFDKKEAMSFNKVFSLAAKFLELCITSTSTTVSARELTSIKSNLASIDTALSYLMDNSAKQVSIDEMSKHVMMSKRKFEMTFSSVVGQSPHSYLTALRMSNAIHLLRKTDKSISEIAEACGFFDSNHFNRTCKKMVGLSPLAFRRDMSKWTREFGDALYQERKARSWCLTYDEAGAERHWYAMSFY